MDRKSGQADPGKSAHRADVPADHRCGYRSADAACSILRWGRGRICYRAVYGNVCHLCNRPFSGGYLYRLDGLWPGCDPVHDPAGGPGLYVCCILGGVRPAAKGWLKTAPCYGPGFEHQRYGRCGAAAKAGAGRLLWYRGHRCADSHTSVLAGIRPAQSLALGSVPQHFRLLQCRL